MKDHSLDARLPPALQIQLLGAFAVQASGVRIAEEQWHSQRARSLVKLLALAPGHRLQRDQIIDSLWPDSDLAAAANNLHQTLHAARRILSAAGAGCLVLEEGTLSLWSDDSRQLVVDVEQFEFAAGTLSAANALAAAEDQHEPQDYLAALALYTGELLPGDRYAEWAAPRREALSQLYQRLLLALARRQEAIGESAAAIDSLQRALAADPCSEEAHSGLMRLYALAGQRQKALRQYQALREALRKNLDIEPAEATTRLFKDIHSGRYAPQQQQKRPAHNLPEELTSLIGRDRQVAALKQIFLSEHSRMLTVIGAGGTGKTRLALRAARELAPKLQHGAWLVRLAPLNNPLLVPTAALSALGVNQAAGRTSTEMLVGFLRGRQALLVLDNCEHVADAAASLAKTLLDTCPRLLILATSRELLRVEGETAFYCPSLGLPEETARAHELAGCESAQLFVERAALCQPGFTLGEHNAAAVAQICRLTDGIPLALEMAAACVRMLSVEQIAARLEQAFQLLTMGNRTDLPRHQTLRAVFDWSYDLLSEAERALLRRLSVFRGGWTLAAAEAVCAETAGENGEESLLLLNPGRRSSDRVHLPAARARLLPQEILALLGGLVDKSLALAEPQKSGEVRYRMLEPVRQYARDRLAEEGATAALRQRHLEYFTGLAEEAEPHLRAWGMVEWLERLEAELGNLRLALEWATANSAELGLRLAAAIHWFWHIHGRNAEAIAWLEHLLAAEEAHASHQPRSPACQIARARAILSLGIFQESYTVLSQGDCRDNLRQAQALFAGLGSSYQKEINACDIRLAATEEEFWRHLAAAKTTEDQLGAEYCLFQIHVHRKIAGDLPGARQALQEMLALCRDSGDIDGEGLASIRSGMITYQLGDSKRALALWKDSQACFQAVGNRVFNHILTIYLNYLAIQQGEYRQAMQQAEAELAAGHEMSNPPIMRSAIIQLAQAAWSLGEYEQAAVCCEEGHSLPGTKWYPEVAYFLARAAISRGAYARLPAAVEELMATGLGRIYGLHALGILAARREQAQAAAVLFGAQEKLGAWLPNTFSPAEQAEYDQALASARTALGAQAFALAWEQGRAGDWETAVQAVLEE